MADASFVQSLIDYYVNLLIIQYNSKPKARAEIALYAKVLLADGIFFDVLNGYNLADAEGTQLDVIGIYVGVSRYYRDVSLIDYFSMPSYEDSPTTPPQYGMETYATFAGDDDLNGTLTYDSIIATNNQLIDPYYRTILQLKIILNNMNYSNKAIDAAMWQFFGTAIRPEDMGDMRMAYFITANPTPVMLAAIYNDMLPSPMAVGVAYVNGVTGPMFAMPSYVDNITLATQYGSGFSTYDNYATLPGQTLEYSQVTG